MTPTHDYDFKIGLALGGGGARGFAHLSVLKVLEEAGIPVHVIAGTSMGALMGALYAQAGSAAAAEDQLLRVFRQKGSSVRFLSAYTTEKKGDHFLTYVAQTVAQRIIINLSLNRRSLLSAARLEAAVADLVDEGRLEDLPLPLGAVATDLRSGKGVVLTRGPIRKAVTASSAIPGFFPPIPWGDMLLCDGEVTDLIPVEACYALGADFVIAVDVNRQLERMPALRNTLDMFLRSIRITVHHYGEISVSKAGFLLRPDSQDIAWADFSRLPEMMAFGEAVARENLPALHDALRNPALRRKHYNEDEFMETHLVVA
ncbi:MAG: hypothetical protein C4524_14385 [Candidatus Zixiibacteriota bacterium]|nr:MAG: hypothetical protein C4524_14385 [candidate division Zixibacteria bacterium]